jgi:hypothetical protein
LPSSKRKRRRSAELAAHEKWVCPRGCGKYYRTTSTRSIREHAATCNGIPVTTHVHIRTVSAATAAATKANKTAIVTATTSSTRPLPVVIPGSPSSMRPRVRARHDEIVDADSFHLHVAADGKTPMLMLTKHMRSERPDIAQRMMHDLPQWAPWFASTIEEALLVRSTAFSNMYDSSFVPYH